MRSRPSQSGAGLPVPKNTRLVSGSYAPAFQTAAPPVFQESPDQVSCPAPPGPEWCRNATTCLPVFASKAAIRPRMPKSPPAVPIRTLSFTTTGAIVIEKLSAAIRDLHVPHELAALRIDREQMRVDRAHEQRIAQDRHAAIHASAARTRVGRRLVRDTSKTAARSWHRAPRRRSAPEPYKARRRRRAASPRISRASAPAIPSGASSL